MIEKLMILLTISIVLGIGTTSAYAITNNSPFSTDTMTTQPCSTNTNNDVEYSCAVAYSNGNGAIFTKAKGIYGSTAEAEFTMGSVQLTTSNSKVTYNGIFDVVGTIQEPSNGWVVVHYGVELQKKTWWGWTTTGHCNKVLAVDGNVAKYNQKIQCTINNSGTNTYKVIAYADAVSQTRGTSEVVYADFYTGANRITTDSISIW